MARAPLVEIFHSIQGEGRHVGAPMTFVRVAVCPIRCRYCDTPESYGVSPSFPVTLRDPDRMVAEPNPVTAKRAAELAIAAAGERYGPLPVSFTGGEPLLYPGFLRQTAEILRATGRAIHLETAALDPAALSGLLSVVDHVSADYKLPETLRAGDYRDAHRGCVELAVAAGCTVDVKIVLTRNLRETTFDLALTDLAPFRGGFLLILQPVTPHGDEGPPDWPVVERCAVRAREAGHDLRVLPQVHKVMGLR